MQGRRNLTQKNDMFKHIDIQRQLRGLSLEQFTNSVGINRTTYYRYEQKGDMPASLLLKICDVLDCSANTILGISDGVQINERN